MAATAYDSSSAIKVLTPEAFCYLVDLNTQARVHFQLMPEPISESKSAIYNEIPIVGRSLPQLGYASSSSRIVGLELDFVALEKGGKYTVKWVKDQIRWLEAKTYPRYLNGFTFPPPKLLLIVGDVIGLQCVMTSCTTSWTGPWAIEGPKARPFRGSASIQLQEVGQNGGAWGHPFGHGEALISANQGTYGYAGATRVEIPLANSVVPTRG